MARSNRTFPELTNIKDRPTHESLRQNWQQTYDMRELITTLQSQISTLQSQVSTLQSQVAALEAKVTAVVQ